MGKSLDIQNKGVHIAFAAGTGALVFLDLVAHLLKKSTGLLTEEEDKMVDYKDFKFVFFCAFGKREEAVGYEMCKGLEAINKKKGLHNFEYFARISNE